MVGVTGASGAIYAERFLREAAKHFGEVLAIVSRHALSVFETERGRKAQPPLTTDALLGESLPQVRFLEEGDYFTPPASGSYRHDGMVIVPCSMGTAGRIANGVSDNLMTRAADVCLKEGRPLVLVVRETPLSLVHLRNLTRLAEAGATVLPAAPAWYNRPSSLEELADTVVARILQRLGVEHGILPEWAEE